MLCVESQMANVGPTAVKDDTFHSFLERKMRHQPHTSTNSACFGFADGGSEKESRCVCVCVCLYHALVGVRRYHDDVHGDLRLAVEVKVFEAYCLLFWGRRGWPPHTPHKTYTLLAEYLAASKAAATFLPRRRRTADLDVCAYREAKVALCLFKLFQTFQDGRN